MAALSPNGIEDRFFLLIFTQPIRTIFPADARTLIAADGGIGHTAGAAIQGHAACPDLQRHFISLGRVGGFDPTVKAEAAVVGDPNGFFVSVEADDSADWSEDFFLCDGQDRTSTRLNSSH